MIQIMVVILIVFALIMTLIAYENSDSVFALIGSITWFVAALGTLEIEIPYQMFNATSGVIETGTHVFENLWGISYLFMGLGVVTFIGFSVYTLETLSKKKR